MNYSSNWLLTLIMAEMTSFECSICLEDCLENDLILCPSCGIETCSLCTKSFLLNSDSLVPLCSKCKKRWSPKFTFHSLGEWLEEEYETHLKKLILVREKAKIPGVIFDIKQREQEEMIKAERSYLLQENASLVFQILTAQLSPFSSMEVITALREELQLVRARISDLQDVIEKFQKRKRPNLFFCQCPKQDCEGLANSETKECEICHVKVCEKCHQVEKSHHKCRKDDVETVKILDSTTKPCPKCNTSVSKAGGCDQVFCTNCKTLFSWFTGKEDKGAVHNPEAIRWLRKHGSLEADHREAPCGGIPESGEIEEIVKKVRASTTELLVDIYDSLKYIDDAIADNTPDFDTDDLVEMYIKKEITDEEWAQSVLLIEDENDIKEVNLRLLAEFRHLLLGSFRDLLGEIEDDRVNSYYVKALEFYVDEMNELRKMYNCTSWILNDELMSDSCLILNDIWAWENKSLC